ncbi:MAG: hypothetical protein ACE5GK_11870 [Nitrospiria bacterium]
MRTLIHLRVILCCLMAIGCSPALKRPPSRFGPDFISSEFDRISVFPVEDHASNQPGLPAPLHEPKRFMFSLTEVIEAQLKRKGYEVTFVSHPGKLQSGFSTAPSRLHLQLLIHRFDLLHPGNMHATCSGRLTDRLEALTIWHRTISNDLPLGDQLPSPTLERNAAADCIRSLLHFIPPRWTPLMLP